MKIHVTHDDGTTVEITEGVQVAFDTAYNSMDWSSGFLDLQEMEALASLAEACRFPSFQEVLDSIAARRKEEERLQAYRDRAAAAVRARDAERERVRASRQDAQLRGEPVQTGVVVLGKPLS